MHSPSQVIGSSRESRPRGERAPARDPGRSAVRLLCAADVHLGRQPSRLPEELLVGLPARSLGPAAAWSRLVDLAIELEADAVVLAGDLVEQSDDFYEAYADLHAGVERLTAAGIEVVGVAGNHDLEVLPRLARSLGDFVLLGEGGVWQSHLVEGREGGRVRLQGWSFPGRASGGDPLARPLPERGAEATVGILHCDRDGADDRYAPVRAADLRAANVDAWLLGHIHAPDALQGPRPIGYLGSLTGLDPGEQGERGAWLLDVSAGGGLSVERLPLAPLRWEELEIDVSELVGPDEVHALIVSAVDELHRTLSLHQQRPIAVGIRLLLGGRTRHGDSLRRALQAADPRRDPIHYPLGISYFFHEWRLETLPAVDLERLAAAGDPAGLLAARLRLIRGQGDAGERAELLLAARRRLARIDRRRQFRALSGDGLSDERLAKILEAAAARALDALLRQKDPGG